MTEIAPLINAGAMGIAFAATMYSIIKGMPGFLVLNTILFGVNLLLLLFNLGIINVN